MKLRVLVFFCITFALFCGEARARKGSEPQHGSSTRPKASLDDTFGNGGQVALPVEPGYSDTYGAATKNGDTLVSGGRDLRLLSSSGETVPSFGTGGVLVPPSRKGGKFFLGGLALDPKGRILLVGTSYPAKEALPQAFPVAARILRFLPNGRLDRSFGRGGVIETTFGLPPPRDEAGLPTQSAPSVEATGIAVGPGGRIIVTGSAAIGFGPSCVHDVFQPIQESAAFVARLKHDGAPDLSFGQDGVVGGRELDETPLRAESVGEPVVGPSGVITYRSTAVSACPEKHGRYGMAQLAANGSIRRGLGPGGAIDGRFTALAGEPDGSVVAVARLNFHQGEAIRARLIRIGADGKLDRSFGEHGQSVVSLGAQGVSRPDSLAVDRQGRVLLGGTLATTSEQSLIFLVRLGADGRQEMSFGPNGRVVTPFPNLASAEFSDLFFDSRGRVVTVHRYGHPSGPSGLLVTRFSLTN